jgi:hypothetical protein
VRISLLVFVLLGVLNPLFAAAWQSTLMGQLEQTKSSEATPAALQLRDKLRAVEAQLDRLKYGFSIVLLRE